MLRRLLLALLSLVLLPLAALLPTTPSGAAGTKPPADRVPVPTLSEPPAGLQGHPLWDSWHQLQPFGYTEQEWFVSGTATAADGSTAPYTTRVIVTRPQKRKDFNGSVMLDWVNVTAQFENAVDSLEGREELLRSGWAFVHVSAQAAGICCTPLTPKVWDPARYAALDHPGDAYADDMFLQVARALRTKRVGDVRPMGRLKVRRVVAAGQSQSAGRLAGIVRAHPNGAGVIDGFLVHGGLAGLDYEPRLQVPVLQLNSDWAESTGEADDDPLYRLWDVAGSAHAGLFIGYQQVFGSGPRVAGLPAMDEQGYGDTIEAAGDYGQMAFNPLYPACTVAGASFPMRYAVNTALRELDEWIRTGRAPRPAPRFEFEADGVTPARDADGNVLGGLRLPPIEVPVATYRSTDCELGGTTVPFDPITLQQRYPTFADYEQQLRRATDRAVRKGWLLPVDARDQMRRACAVRDRYPGSGDECRSYRPPRFGG
ncbi:alpha/beta hydrolase domain-containing protein [uncultured Nocardioides sp.]|uniref:alpha/beta hydrolase domain-containing protein n=1 Tax=uncultured Nocardioides sp. TaxID=198441 RepID=UPI0026315E4E|nr:alpha/beta hydrolase domain-containing protein [uncultured Nocardioides sp.]